MSVFKDIVSDRARMVATVLSGKDVAQEVRTDLKRKVRLAFQDFFTHPPGQVEEIKNNDPNFKPGLVIVQVSIKYIIRETLRVLYKSLYHSLST